jgi:hypothetical protein
VSTNIAPASVTSNERTFIAMFSLPKGNALQRIATPFKILQNFR